MYCSFLSNFVFRYSASHYFFQHQTVHPAFKTVELHSQRFWVHWKMNTKI